MMESDFDDTVKSLEEYRKKININTCKWCGWQGLKYQPIDYYDHENGWSVGDRKLWLSVACGKCGYDWSLWKLGVAR